LPSVLLSVPLQCEALYAGFHPKEASFCTTEVKSPPQAVQRSFHRAVWNDIQPIIIH